MTKAYVTIQGLESFGTIADSPAYVSEYGVEVWHTYTAASPSTPTGAGISQYGAEVWHSDSSDVFLSLYGIEVFYEAPFDSGGVSGGVATTSFGYAV